MKLFSAMLAFLLIVVASPAASAQQASTEGLKPVLGLVGDWTGIGDGDPGKSAATRHIELARDGHFVGVEGRSVYPK